MPSITDIPCIDDLKNLGVSEFKKQGQSILLLLCKADKNKKDVVIIFPISKDGPFDTLMNFENAAKWKLDSKTVQEIEAVLSQEDNGYLNFLLYGNGEEVDDKPNNTNDEERSRSDTTQKPLCDPSKELDPYYIPDKDYAEFVIQTAKKTVKQEDALVRQILYTGLSKDSADPINLAVLAPTSEGKTYAVLETIQYFPKEDVWNYGSMSPKVIIRQNGILVDSNGQPLEPRIKELKKQIKTAEKEGHHDQKIELESDLLRLYNDAKVLIDLRGKLLVFLDPPHKETWAILKPILSHDKSEIEHPYVYNVEGHGFKVKNIVTRGWPACIFCSAKNESNWPEWPEIQSRFLITSPNMIPQKYLEGNRLIAQRKGLPRLLQQSLIVSDRDVKLAKRCVVYLIQEMRKYTNSEVNPSPVWIPFGEILAEVLHSEKGTDNRITKRIFAFLSIVALARGHLRYRLEYGKESLVIADIEEDLHEVLHITQNVSGIPTYKLRFFQETFLPLFNTKIAPDKSADGEEEKRIAVTTRQLCDYYKEDTGKSISTNNLNETYRMDNILQHPMLLIPKNCRKIPENWLKLDIFDL